MEDKWKLVALACRCWDVSIPEMTGEGKSMPLVRQRQVVMWLLRKRLGITFPTIAKMFKKDHTTALHAMRRVDKLLAEGDELTTKLLFQVEKFLKSPEEAEVYFNELEQTFEAYLKTNVIDRLRREFIVGDQALRKQLEGLRKEVQEALSKAHEIKIDPKTEIDRGELFAQAELAKKQEAQRKIRTCIHCGNKFKSWGPGNRRCNPCKLKGK